MIALRITDPPKAPAMPESAISTDQSDVACVYAGYKPVTFATIGTSGIGTPTASSQRHGRAGLRDDSQGLGIVGP